MRLDNAQKYLVREILKKLVDKNIWFQPRDVVAISDIMADAIP